MGKRSNFPRIDKDFYRTTDARAIAPLLAHVPPGTAFAEPCAGAGDLVDRLEAAGLRCLWAGDAAPLRGDIHQCDALNITECPGEMFVTNPPWSRGILHELIVHLSNLAPAWLLFDADWMHTRQARELMPRCRAIVSVGRVRWFESSPNDGMDNCAWYLFDARRKRPVWGGAPLSQTLFYPGAP